MIFEDPDELGYYTDQEAAKGQWPSDPDVGGRRNAHRTAGMSRVGGGCPFDGIAMTRQDFDDIEAAAINAHEDRDRAAERCRRYAGYGGC